MLEKARRCWVWCKMLGLGVAVGRVRKQRREKRLFMAMAMCAWMGGVARKGKAEWPCQPGIDLRM